MVPPSAQMENSNTISDLMSTHHSNRPASYEFGESPELSKLLLRIDSQKSEIDRLMKGQPSLWPTVQEKLKFTWTYDSNAIEGSTLSLGETIFYLREGLTVEGKPLKDFLDASNHAEAIDFLHDVISNQRPVSEGLMKEINAMLLSGVKSIPALNERGEKTEKKARPGEYKQVPNHVLKTDGAIHPYVEPIHVAGEMQRLCHWIAEQEDRRHALVIAAVAHYNMVRIHPFDDGNGRGARILMNLILMKAGYPPAIVKNEQRRTYLEVLGQADGDDLDPFVEFIAGSLVETQDVILADFRAE